MMENKEEPKNIDVDSVLSYLSTAFSNATKKAESVLTNKAIRFKNEKGEWETTPLYDYQVDFCYLVNEIKNGPNYIVPKLIQDANNLISEIENLVEK